MNSAAYFDYNDAEAQQGAFDLIPKGTLVRVRMTIKPGGHFFIGHSESLNGISSAVQPLFPSIYRKPPGHAQSAR